MDIQKLKNDLSKVDRYYDTEDSLLDKLKRGEAFFVDEVYDKFSKKQIDSIGDAYTLGVMVSRSIVINSTRRIVYEEISRNTRRINGFPKNRVEIDMKDFVGESGIKIITSTDTYKQLNSTGLLGVLNEEQKEKLRNHDTSIPERDGLPSKTTSFNWFLSLFFR